MPSKTIGENARTEPLVYLVDISRLVENLHTKTPTGIDRVEMAYAQHFLGKSGQSDVRFVVTWPHFSGVLKETAARPLIETLAKRWSDQSTNIAEDASFNDLRAVLEGPVTRGARGALRLGREGARTNTRPLLDSASIWLRSAASRISAADIGEFSAKRAWYLHVSQFRLNRPARFEWLADPGIRSLFLLHDLIPITHPEYCRPGEAVRHRERVDTMLARASLIIANSAYTKNTLERFCRAEALSQPRCEAVPLGVEAVFRAPPAVTPIAGQLPYFVVIGTIEPRKNLGQLLQLWHRWVDSGRLPRGRLVVVGRRGWENENIIEQLERSAGLDGTVIEVNSLNDAGMVALMRGAAALLAPSWVEGYGLPIVEAMTLGVPVIASDIDAFREVGEGRIDHVDPIDGMGWLKALDDYADPASERRTGQLERLKSYRPTSWSDHLQRVEDVMAEVGQDMLEPA